MRALRIYLYPLGIFGGRITDSGNKILYIIKSPWWRFGGLWQLLSQYREPLAHSIVFPRFGADSYRIQVLADTYSLTPISKLRNIFGKISYELTKDDRVDVKFESSGKDRILATDSKSGELIVDASEIQLGVGRYWFVEGEFSKPEHLISLALMCQFAKSHRESSTR